jgi:hypothetical protein
MNVARPVLRAQHLPTLRLVGGDRAIAGHFAVVRIEAAAGPGDAQPGGNHRAIHIDGQAAQPQQSHDRGDQFLVQAVQRGEVPPAKFSQPAAEAARGRHAPQPTEPLDQRIVSEVADMPQPAPADDQQGEDQSDHLADAEIGVGHSPDHMPAKRRAQSQSAKVPPHKLQSRIRRQLGVGEPQAQLALDPAPQIRFPVPHWEWPFVAGSFGCVVQRNYHNDGPFSLSTPVLRSNFLQDQG